MLNKEEKNNHLLDIQSKIYNKNLTQLSITEVTLAIQNIFYQLFLVQLSEVDFNITSSPSGTSVSFNLSGECFRESTVQLEELHENVEDIEDEE